MSKRIGLKLFFSSNQLYFHDAVPGLPISEAYRLFPGVYVSSWVFPGDYRGVQDMFPDSPRNKLFLEAINALV